MRSTRASGPPAPLIEAATIRTKMPLTLGSNRMSLIASAPTTVTAPDGFTARAMSAFMSWSCRSQPTAGDQSPPLSSNHAPPASFLTMMLTAGGVGSPPPIGGSKKAPLLGGGLASKG